MTNLQYKLISQTPKYGLIDIFNFNTYAKKYYKFLNLRLYEESKFESPIKDCLIKGAISIQSSNMIISDIKF